MKIIAIPLEAIVCITSRSFVASLSVSTAVGSSKTSTLIAVLSISRAISTNCI